MKAPWGKQNSIVLHFNHPDFTKKYMLHVATHNFAAEYAAKCFIDTVIEHSTSTVPNPQRKWKGPNTLSLNDWIVVTTDDLSSISLEDLMEYNYSKEERKWRLPHPYAGYAEQIARYNQGSHPDVNTRALEGRGLSRLTDEQLKPLGLLPKVADRKALPKLDKKPKSEKEPKKKSGLITLADICKPLKIDPREARQALRKAKTPKPAEGWAWSPADKDKITKIVEKAIKELRK